MSFFITLSGRLYGIIEKIMKSEKRMSMSKIKEKTNVMRILDKLKINYNSYDYLASGAISGIDVAHVLNQNPDKVFKTLVTVGTSNENYVFLVPVNKELDLKKAAKSVEEKKIEMVKSKDLLNLTGYIHGGCSPIGMKKYFHTVIDQSAQQFDNIIFSAGKIGYQVELGVAYFEKVITVTFGDIIDSLKTSNVIDWS